MGKYLLSLLLAPLLLCACGKKEPPVVPQGSEVKAGSSPETVSWSFAPEALTLHVQASSDLNMYDNQAHTLLLCVYQLDKTAAFREKTTNPDGLATLLECGRFDPSVKNAERHFVAPGLMRSYVMDRVEEAKHVAVVAGYAELSADTATRTWAIPLVKQTSGSLWWKDTFYYPSKLDMVMQLGATALQRVSSQPKGGK